MGGLSQAKRARVLMIDDEQELAEAIRHTLRGKHDFVYASTGQEGIALLDKDSAFHVIFCDLMMPEVTGMDVYAAVKNKHPGLEHRIYFMTGGAFTPRAREFLDGLPAHRVLEKPFEFKLLFTLITQSVEMD